MYRDQKVLVTGGTGVVGRELVELLVKAGADVTSVSLDENNFEPEWSVRYLKQDLRNKQVCLDACRGMDYVFHIAGIKGSPVVTSTKQYIFFNSLLQLNTNMIDAMYQSNIKWGLYTSTVGTYGQAKVFKEEDLWQQNPSPNDWFAGWAKRMGEVQIDAYQEQYKKRHISIMKPVNIYGKFDNHDLKTSTLVPSLVAKVANASGTVDIWGDGSTQRDIIHARDVARAAMLLVEQKVAEPVNIGRGTGHTIQEVIETLVQISAKDLEITHDLTKPTGDGFRVANIDRLKQYGFEPTISLKEGLQETFEWFLKNPNHMGRFKPFSEEEVGVYV